MLSSNVIAPPSPNWCGCHLVATQPSTQLVAYAGHNSVVVADCNTHSVLRTLCAGISRTTSVAWAPGPSTLLVSGHDDGSMRAWDAGTGACVRSHRKKGPEVSALIVLNRQPPMAVAGDSKGGLTAWAWHDGSKPKPIGVGGGALLRSKIMALAALPTTNAAPTPTGLDTSAQLPQQHLVLAASQDGSVALVDVDSGTIQHTFAAHRGMVTALHVHSPAAGSSSEEAGAGMGWAAPAAAIPLVVTASGDDGTVKVWQYSRLAVLQPPTCLSVISVSGGGAQAKGGAAGGRGARGWLSACIVPHPVGYAAGSSCWVAVGTGAGEVYVHTVNLSNGRTSGAVRNHRLHSRPIYSIDAFYICPTPGTQAGVAAAAPECKDGAATEPPPQSDSATASATAATAAVAAAATDAALADEPAAGTGQEQVRRGAVDLHGQLVLVTASQDRTLVLSELLLADETQVAAAQKAKQATQPDQAPGSSQTEPPAPPPPPPPIPQAHGEAGQQDSNWPGLPAPAAKQEQAAAAAAPAPAVAASSQRVRPVVERTAQGPVPGSRGFGGPLLRRAAAGTQQRGVLADVVRGVEAQAVTAAAQSDEEKRAGPEQAEEEVVTSSREKEGASCEAAAGQEATGGMEEVGGGQDSCGSPAVASHRLGAMSVVELQRMWRGVVLRAKGIALLWRLTGLGGYAYAVDVAAVAHVPAAEQAVSSTGASTAAVEGVESAGPEADPSEQAAAGDVEVIGSETAGAAAAGEQQRLSWQLAVGCGDKTVRWLGVSWAGRLARGVRGGASRAAQPVTCPATISAGSCSADDGGGTEDGTQGSGQAAVAGDVAEGGGGFQSCEEAPGQRWVPRGPPSMAMSTLWRQVADQVLCVACHPCTTRYLAFGCQDGQVGIFDTRTHAAFVYPIRHQGPVLQVRWLGAPAAPEASSAKVQASPVSELESSPPPPPPPPPSSDSETSIATATVSGSTATEPEAPPTQATASETKARKQPKQKQHPDTDHGGSGLDGSWWLVSSGGEGRLLAWKAPDPGELVLKVEGAGGQQGGRGRADREGAWGAQPAAKPQHMPEDLGSYLGTLLEPDVATSQGPHTMTACTAFTTSHHAGAMMLVASLRGGSAVGVFRWSVPGGGAAAAAGGRACRQPLSGAGCGWALVAAVAPGSPASLVACGVPSTAPDTLAVACAHGAGGVTISHIQLPDILPQPSGPTITPSTSIPAEVIAGTVSSLCWLAGCSALAVAGSDGTVALWQVAHTAQAAGGASCVPRAAPAPAPDAQGSPAAGGDAGAQVADAGAAACIPPPQLLTSLRGHTDQVLGMASGSLPASPTQPQGRDTFIAWLFTAARDQAVRAWALDVPQLEQQLAAQQRQKQQQELEAARAKAQAKLDALVAAASGASPSGDVVAGRDGTEVAACVAGTGGVEQGPQGAEVASAGQAGAPAAGLASGSVAGDEAGSEAVAGEVENEEAGASDLPAFMAAAPANSLLAGMPGSRKKKGPSLGAKPILARPVAQVVEAGASALSDLTAALGPQAELLPGPSTQQPGSTSTAPVPFSELSAEKQVVAHMWKGDVRAALQVAVSNSCLTADLVSCSACLGRPVWAAASRLYATQQEAAGQPHVAAMHLVAIGDAKAAAEVYSRAGLLAEASQVRL